VCKLIKMTTENNNGSRIDSTDMQGVLSDYYNRLQMLPESDILQLERRKKKLKLVERVNSMEPAELEDKMKEIDSPKYG
jgi:hypothetical protein